MNTFQNIEITSAGGIFTIDVNNAPDTVYIYITGSVTLANDVAIGLSGTPPDGLQILYVGFGLQSINQNGKQFSINANNYSLSTVGDLFYATLNANAVISNVYGKFFPDLGLGGAFDGQVIQDETIPLIKLVSIARGSLVVGNASLYAQEFALGTSGKILQSNGVDLVYNPVTGDISIDNTGLTAIGANKIVNSQINSSAAIAFNKMAALTASKALVTNGSGVVTTANQISPLLGGTGQDLSSATGLLTFNAGTAAVGARTESITVPVSFATASQCANHVKFPYACTITDFYAVVTTALAGTDAGTITPKNGSGTSMTLSAPLSFPASSALDTALDVSATADNVIAANDIISLTTAKTTGGGTALVTITFTRTN